MQDKDMMAILADYIRDHGKEITQDGDENDTWSVEGPNGTVKFQSEDEYTNRVMFQNILDVTENTFQGFRYRRGSFDDFEKVFNALKPQMLEKGIIITDGPRDTKMS